MESSQLRRISGTSTVVEEEDNVFKENEKRPIFTEMAELEFEQNGVPIWKQVARWVKYEEQVEKGGQRWSKPFIPTVTLQSLTQLRNLLQSQTLALDSNVKTVGGIWEFITDRWVSEKHLDASKRETVLGFLLSHHAHLYQGSAPSAPGDGDTLGPLKPLRKSRYSSRVTDTPSPEPNLTSNLQSEVRFRKVSQMNPKKSNTNFQKKVPPNSEALVIHVGGLECLDKPISAFVRLKDGVMLGNLTEIPLPTKFIFVVVGGKDQTCELHGYGRALAILMLNSGFKEIAYNVRNREELIHGVNSYMDSTTVLPPPEGWDPGTRIEPQQQTGNEGDDDSTHSGEIQEPNGLRRTGKLFGGLVEDIKRKIKFYVSDFRDAFSLQCIATWLFLYFACLTPLITFGGLLGEKTDNYMGTMETLLAGCLAGVSFALFSGQPLLILGATGPMLVFETILMDFTKNFSDLNLNYLELRLWVGIWITIILLVLVALDGSAFVNYITKFTEENFATLIALIFMYEAFKNLASIADKEKEDASSNSTNISADDTTTPTNTFLMSILLFIGTFLIALLIQEFRSSSFLPAKIRTTISDFGVILAIGIMAGTDALVGLATPKLVVPSKFEPTIPDRGWLISPFDKNPVWVCFAACAPALLATILIFMDQQITAVIINRKSHKLKKGCGYHLDLTILAILILVNSFLGLPWFVAATVESVTNIGSLKIESSTTAPGEKPQFLGVREQRVTNLLIFITVGVSIFMGPVLKLVPMPVLYGVFLYMGFSALRKMELFERILLFFIPGKYQPDLEFLRRVRLRRVHFYTGIQVSCLILLWTIKSISQTAIFFPLMLIVMMGVRKLLERVFSTDELIALDDLLPGQKKILEKEQLV